MNASNTRKMNVSENLVGVSGWLLLLCVSLTILSPLQYLYPIVRAMISSDKIALSSYIPTISFTVPAIFKIATYAMIIYGVVVGIRLWLVKPNALRDTKAFLIVLFAVSILGVVRSLVYGAAFRQILVPAIRSVIFFAVWWSYLTKSIRVRNTYKVARERNTEGKAE